MSAWGIKVEASPEEVDNFVLISVRLFPIYSPNKLADVHNIVQQYSL